MEEENKSEEDPQRVKPIDYASIALEEEVGEFLPEPPDGGWGWVIVFASFMANVVVDGISYSFGIFLFEFQSYFHSTKGVTAIVGSLLTGCYLIAGPVVSGLVNRFGSRIVMIMGGLISSVAFFLCVWSPTVTILMVLYGIVGGLGFGLIYLPAIVHVGYYFEKRRALATGIAVAGSGFGTFVFAPLSVVLLEQFGWKGSLWIMAGFILNCCVCGALLRPLKPKRIVTYSFVDSDGERTVLADLKPTDVIRVGSALALDPKAALKLQLLNPQYDESLNEEGHRVRSHSVKFAPKVSFDPDLPPKQRHRTRSRVTARTYAQSMGQLASMPCLSPGALKTMASVDPNDFLKPMYRKDIFYARSITRLPEFTMSRGDLNAYRESMIAIPQQKRSVLELRHLSRGEEEEEEEEEAEELEEGWCSFLPDSVRFALMEMAGLDLLKEPVMLLLCFSNIMGMLGFYCPYVFLTEKAGLIGVSPKDASFLLSIMGITNTLGRVFFGWFSDQGWLSAITINNISLIASAVLTGLVPFFTSYPLMVCYAALFGFIVSSYISLTSIILVDYLGLELLTNSFGLLILARGVACMVGSPLAGLVYDLTGSYDASFYYSAAMLMCAGLISCMVPLVGQAHRVGDFFRSLCGRPPVMLGSIEDLSNGELEKFDHTPL